MAHRRDGDFGMIKSEREKLKQLAEMATKWGEIPCPEKLYIFGNDRSAIIGKIRWPYSIDDGLAETNHDFINAANPTAILSLLDSYEKLESAYNHASKERDVALIEFEKLESENQKQDDELKAMALKSYDDNFKIINLETKNARLREALDFYGNKADKLSLAAEDGEK